MSMRAKCKTRLLRHHKARYTTWGSIGDAIAKVRCMIVQETVKHVVTLYQKYGLGLKLKSFLKTVSSGNGTVAQYYHSLMWNLYLYGSIDADLLR